MDDSRIISLARMRSLGVGVLVLALLAVGGGAWLGQAATAVAVAPEPARLTTDLYGSTGATAAAVYTCSEAATTVVKWTGTYTWSSNPPSVGVPCSTGDLPWGTTTLKVIQGGGAYRRCY